MPSKRQPRGKRWISPSPSPYPEEEFTMSHSEAAEYIGCTTFSLYNYSCNLWLHSLHAPTEYLYKDNKTRTPSRNFYCKRDLDRFKARFEERKVWKRKLSEFDIGMGCDLYEQGCDLHYVARFLGVGVPRLKRILDEYGVRIRRRSEGKRIEALEE